MKYLFIEKEAISQIATSRSLQSPEFEVAQTLISFLKDFKDNRLNGVVFATNKDGAFIFLEKKCNLNNAIIFDLEKFKDFDIFSNEEILTAFQKILKYAIKHWEGLPLSSCEKNLLDGIHSIIYPFPYTSSNAYRVLINNKPDRNYTDKRNLNYLYVSGGGTRNLKTEYTILNLKRIKEEASVVCVEKSIAPTASTLVNSLDVNVLEELNCNKITPTLGFENWKYQLTTNQIKFVEKDITGPERLEGAAGTGKTLTMILRAIYILRKKKEQNIDFHMIFLTHSVATKNQIRDIFLANCPELENMFDRNHSSASIEITTLQEWCINYLGGGLGKTEFLDRDAQETKELQLLYLDEAFESCMSSDYDSYKLFCSEKFIDFIKKTPKNSLLDMIQSEIAVTIKGRANENIETYRILPRFKYSLPLQDEGDYNFIYLIYEKYQRTLQQLGYFDNDDITLSAIGQLNTPIWRRRKRNEGYNAIFIDETHLFNYNELSVFHHLCSNEKEQNIIFAIDKSQAIGDKGLSNDNLNSTLGIRNVEIGNQYHTVFRSSPEIVNLAFTVLSSGATLFTNFDNPMEKVNYSFTVEEEKKTQSPLYILKENDDLMIDEAFKVADNLCHELNITRHKILIVCSTSELLAQTVKFASLGNKPYEILKQRGDIEVVKSAEKKNRYVIGMIDYVGGLEFDAVIIIGVDKGRVPPTEDDEHNESQHFQNFAWHNRMYIAVTRAKYVVYMIGEKTRGESLLLSSAINNGILKVKER